MFGGCLATKSSRQSQPCCKAGCEGGGCLLYGLRPAWTKKRVRVKISSRWGGNGGKTRPPLINSASQQTSGRAGLPPRCGNKLRHTPINYKMSGLLANTKIVSNHSPTFAWKLRNYWCCYWRFIHSQLWATITMGMPQPLSSFIFESYNLIDIFCSL